MSDEVEAGMLNPADPDNRCFFDRVSGCYKQYPDIDLHGWHVDGLRPASRHSFSVLVGNEMSKTFFYFLCPCRRC